MVSNASYIWIMGDIEDVISSSSSFREEKVRISFLIKPIDSKELLSVLQYVFTQQSTAQFALTIDCREEYYNAENEAEWMETFFALLCHLDYYKVNNQSIITFLKKNTNPNEIDPLKKKLLDGLKTQGFDHVNMIDIDTAGSTFDHNSGVASVNKSLLDSFDDFWNFYTSKLMLSEVPLSFFIVNDPGMREILQKFKKEAEIKLFREESHLFQLINSVHKKSVALEKIVQQKAIIAEELQSKNRYLNFLLKKTGEYGESDIQFSDLIRLKKFYATEYEILPLWYKRFGHIIKVLMGKRTFRSLFRDDVKKYKD